MRSSQIRLSKAKKTEIKDSSNPKNQYIQKIESLRKQISENKRHG